MYIVVKLNVILQMANGVVLFCTPTLIVGDEWKGELEDNGRLKARIGGFFRREDIGNSSIVPRCVELMACLVYVAAAAAAATEIDLLGLELDAKGDELLALLLVDEKRQLVRLSIHRVYHERLAALVLVQDGLLFLSAQTQQRNRVKQQQQQQQQHVMHANRLGFCVYRKRRKKGSISISDTLFSKQLLFYTKGCRTRVRKKCCFNVNRMCGVCVLSLTILYVRSQSLVRSRLESFL